MIAIIQARMSSMRLPGKILMKLGSEEILLRVYRQVSKAINPSNVYVATSTDITDDLTANFCLRNNIRFYRGSLNNVVERFSMIVNETNASSFIRISADSPLIDVGIISRAIEIFNNSDESVDLVTNVFPRTFPKGQSVEIVRSRSFLKLLSYDLTEAQKEHLTSYFYDNSVFFRILNFKNITCQREINQSVDTAEDLYRLEQSFQRI